MRKIFILLVALLTIGCDLYYLDLASGHILYYGDFSEIKEIEDIDNWLSARIIYRADYEESWSNLKETLLRGYGDCDDIAIGYLNILSIKFGIEGSLVLTGSSELKAVVSGGFSDHVLVMCQGILVDPRTGEVFGKYENLKSYVTYIYSFEEIFY